MTAPGRISLAGFWLWPWALWHLAWVFGMFVVPAAGWDVLRWYMWLYACFLPLEIAGAVDLRDDADPRRAKTLSQWRQFVAQMSDARAPSWLSWKGLAGGSGVFDAIMVGLIVRHGMVPPFGPWVGTALGLVVGATVAVWLVPHFREGA